MWRAVIAINIIIALSGIAVALYGLPAAQATNDAPGENMAAALLSFIWLCVWLWAYIDVSKSRRSARGAAQRSGAYSAASDQ